ncbi:MAG TPA: V-type ATP synthase subunit F [Candidatus Monoglobus merdigallinarum]|uniref:V-type ATP synthase subunit F n=1 Tax=Candidatus Monoglobus merdigallinarum TaxID=2838698 RepID=A0A9D1TL72_9FIRM|nr:V-type ATP synthase subunit F [Candidatus Monoglobus merdigallinarum]
MYNIAVVGDRDSVMGFGALGLKTFFVEDRAQCRRVFKHLTEAGNYAVIYITEAAAEFVPDEIESCEDRMIPAVILIPGVSGNTGSGIKGVKNAVEKAVGSDIIFND